MSKDISQVIHANKELGETPLMCLERYRELLSLDAGVSMTYAGRLDPAATGQLILLSGERVHEKEQYMHMDKQYRAEVLFGVSTDSYDVLGMVGGQRRSDNGPAHISAPPTDPDLRSIIGLLHEYIGEISLSYPPYSSRTVMGKPLWSWAREGKLDEIRGQWPIQQSVIHTISYSNPRIIETQEILNRVQLITESVGGDFRQNEIMKSWQGWARDDSEKNEKDHSLPGAERTERGDLVSDRQKYFLLPITITCSSGTYIRSIAHNMGERLGTGACLYSLERVKYLEKR